MSLRRLEDRNGGRRPDISDVEVLHREYNLQDILAALENSLKGTKREQELIPLLNSTPAFAFLGKVLFTLKEIDEQFCKLYRGGILKGEKRKRVEGIGFKF